MASRLRQQQAGAGFVVGGGDRDKDWALQYNARGSHGSQSSGIRISVTVEEKVNRMMLIRFPEDDADTPHADATGVEKQHQEMPSASTHVKEQHQETQSAETPAGFCLTSQELHRKQSARKVKRLKNQQQSLSEIGLTAKQMAQDALQKWYRSSTYRARQQIRLEQQNANFEELMALPDSGFTIFDEYVMLRALFDEKLTPIVVALDRLGRLTYKSLHQQIRKGLGMELKESLKICPFRPWYIYEKDLIKVFDKNRLPSDITLCTHLLGTTFLYYRYVHLTE